MLSPEFESTYKSAQSTADREAILQIAGDWFEEQGQPANAELCRGRGPISLIWCPAGKFIMGSSKKEGGRYLNETRVRVTLTQGFWMGKYTVTQEQWERLMGTSIWDLIPENHPTLIGAGQNWPIYYVTWTEAKAFCHKLSKQERKQKRLPKGWVYDLPTSAQWEYACRAGTKTRFSFRGREPIDEYLWCRTNSNNVPHEVGTKKANPWGLHDMHGNVWEWCEDQFEYGPPGGNDPIATNDDPDRVLRGGTSNHHPDVCRSAVRTYGDPDERYLNCGFRVVVVQARS